MWTASPHFTSSRSSKSQLLGTNSGQPETGAKGISCTPRPRQSEDGRRETNSDKKYLLLTKLHALLRSICCLFICVCCKHRQTS